MARRKSKSEKLRIKRSLITYSHPDNKISDQFRGIRANLDYVTGDSRLRVVVVTTPNHGEGATTTAVNLAVSLAQRGDKVLLVDADFRKPAMHDIFGIKNIPGLTNVLTGQVHWQEAVHRTEIGRLELLTSGPALFNSAEMLGSRAMRELMDAAGNVYDRIVLDVSPVLETADIQLLSGACDGTILVVWAGRTKSECAIEAKKLLDMAKANLVGIVVNEG